MTDLALSLLSSNIARPANQLTMLTGVYPASPLRPPGRARLDGCTEDRRCLHYAELMLGRRHRRRASITSTLDKHLVFAGIQSLLASYHVS